MKMDKKITVKRGAAAGPHIRKDGMGMNKDKACSGGPDGGKQMLIKPSVKEVI